MHPHLQPESCSAKEGKQCWQDKGSGGPGKDEKTEFIKVLESVKERRSKLLDKELAMKGLSEETRALKKEEVSKKDQERTTLLAFLNASLSGLSQGDELAIAVSEEGDEDDSQGEDEEKEKDCSVWRIKSVARLDKGFDREGRSLLLLWRKGADQSVRLRLPLATLSLESVPCIPLSLVGGDRELLRTLLRVLDGNLRRPFLLLEADD